MQELVAGMESLRVDLEADVEQQRGAQPLPFPGTCSEVGARALGQPWGEWRGCRRGKESLIPALLHPWVPLGWLQPCEGAGVPSSPQYHGEPGAGAPPALSPPQQPSPWPYTHWGGRFEARRPN